MKIPFLDIGPKISAEREELHRALDRVLDSKVFILGKEVEEFEKAFAADLGLAAGNAVSCNSGTDAIVLGLKALGVGAGDEVIAPSHTAIPTITAIRALGALPVFADVDPATWVLDARDALAQRTPKTRAIVAVHLYGNAVDLGALQSVRDLVLEDVAQAHGGSYRGAMLGTWGRCGAYSFYPTKNLGALGDAGALACRDIADAARSRSLRYYGQSSRYRAEVDGGMNSRLDELQAAFLRLRLRSYREDLSRKARLRKFYEEAFRGLPIKLQQATADADPAWHLLVVACESTGARARVAKALEEESIGSLVHYPIPTHLQPAFAAFRRRSLPATESLCERILSLPFYAGLSEADASQVADVIRRALR